MGNRAYPEDPFHFAPLWDAILDVYDVFSAICQKHGLRHYVIGGTLLGAVRHKGFIPWDDDFDLAMPRQDYEKLKLVIDKELPEHLKFVDHSDSHQHHFEERAVFVGCGVRAVGTNESNTYRRTGRKNTVFRSANQYSRTQPITCRKRRFLNCRGAVGRLKNGFSAIHTDTNISILDDNICGMIHFSEWLSILTNIGIQVNTTAI